MRTLGDIREYLRDVLEIDDLTDQQADQHIRHAYRRVIDEEDWPSLLDQRLLPREWLVDGRVVYPVTLGPIRRVLSVYAVNDDGHETAELLYEPYRGRRPDLRGRFAGVGEDAVVGSVYTGWSFLPQPQVYTQRPPGDPEGRGDEFAAPNGVVFCWPRLTDPDARVGAWVVEAAELWPGPLHSSDNRPPAGGGQFMTPGMVTAVEYFAVSEAAAQYADTSLVTMYRNKGEMQLDVERRNTFPVVNAPVRIGPQNRRRVRRASRRRGRG